MSSPIPDIDLWSAAAAGDREAFGQLFRRHYGLLHQYGSKICTDTPMLEDCIQELFVELWQKKKDAPVTYVKAYLLQALKYKLYKTFRDQRPTRSLDGAEEPFEIGHDHFLVTRDEDRARTAGLAAALNKLPPRQKEVIYLKIYKGLRYEEVSEVMGLNYQVVRNLLCQALKSFRKLME